MESESELCQCCVYLSSRCLASCPCKSFSQSALETLVSLVFFLSLLIPPHIFAHHLLSLFSLFGCSSFFFFFFLLQGEMIALSSGSKTPGRVSEAERPNIIYERSSTIPWRSSKRKDAGSKENASKKMNDVDGTPKGPSPFKRNVESLVRDIHFFFFIPHTHNTHKILFLHNDFCFCF